jgi:putative sigma-54 modulation protein
MRIRASKNIVQLKLSVTMDINVKTIKFDATDKLQEFIQKKVGKLDKLCNDIRKVEVSLKVVKPETAMNKQASLTVVLPKTELFAEKICDTFEEAIMESLAAIEKQLGKYKEKQTNI